MWTLWLSSLVHDALQCQKLWMWYTKLRRRNSFSGYLIEDILGNQKGCRSLVILSTLTTDLLSGWQIIYSSVPVCWSFIVFVWEDHCHAGFQDLFQCFLLMCNVSLTTDKLKWSSLLLPILWWFVICVCGSIEH